MDSKEASVLAIKLLSFLDVAGPRMVGSGGLPFHIKKIEGATGINASQLDELLAFARENEPEVRQRALEVINTY